MYDHLLSLDFFQGAVDAGASTLSAIALDTESQVTSYTATPDVIVGNVKGIQI